MARDPTPLSRDSRGIVYAQLGRRAEAIAEFERFLAWLRTQPAPTFDRYAPKRQAWINALQHGRDPFDDQTLHELREEQDT